MSITLDDIDRAIIRLLQKDGRMSSRAICRELEGLGDRAVRYRIERLIRDRVIFVGAVVSAAAVGCPVMGDIIIDAVPWKLEEIAAQLAEVERVSYVAVSLREGHVSIQFNAADEQELMAFTRGLAQTHEGITRVQTTVLPTLLKDITDWPAPGDG